MVDIGINKLYFYSYASAVLIGIVSYGFFGVGYQVITSLKKNEKENKNTTADEILITILIFAYSGAIIGSIISSVIVSIGKRLRIIGGNLCIVIFSTGLYLYDNTVILSISSAMYGFGIGIIMTTVPVYLKEIAPVEILSFVLSLIGPAMVIANEIAFCFDYIVRGYTLVHESNFTIFIFAMPSIIALIQLLLFIFVFRHDTVLHLARKMEEDVCLTELHKIYPDIAKRMVAFDNIREIIHSYSYQYPSYKELLSEKFFGNTIKGASIMIMRDCSGIFITMILTSIVYSNKTNGYEISNNILTMSNLLGTIICCLFIYIVGMKHLFIIGAIVVALTNGLLFIFQAFYNKEELEQYSIVTTVISSIKFIFYGFSTCTIPFIYACEILTERGFAIAMAFHWTLSGILIISFLGLLLGYKEFEQNIYTGYMGFFTIASIGVIIYAMMVIPKSNKSQDDIRKSFVRKISESKFDDKDE